MNLNDGKQHRQQAEEGPIGLIDANELHRLIPISKMQIWRMENASPSQFPRRIKLPGGRKNFWILREILTWIDEQAAKRGTSMAAKQRDTGCE